MVRSCAFQFRMWALHFGGYLLLSPSVAVLQRVHVLIASVCPSRFDTLLCWRFAVRSRDGAVDVLASLRVYIHLERA